MAVEFLHDHLTARVGSAEDGAERHLHRRHADAFYVLEGEHVALTADGEVPLGAGGFFVAAPGVVHGFGASDALFLNLHAPGAEWMKRALARREGRRIPSAEYDTYDADGGRGAVDIVPPGEGELLAAAERRAWIKAARPELVVFEVEITGAFVEPKRHFHRQHVDAFFVLDGELEVERDGATQRLRAGELAAFPPGVVHTFRNSTDGAARYLNIHAPGMQFDDYLRELDRLARAGESATDELRARYDNIEVE